MSIRDFVYRAEQISKENINRDYRSIDMLQYELNFLNDLLNRYSNKKSGRTFSFMERQDKIASIRDRIPRVYEDINYYKECINCERKEMRRIHNTYGCVFKSVPYNEEKYIQLTNDIVFKDNGENEYDIDDSYEYGNEGTEELEEIKEYKYNPVTDTFE